MASCALPAVVPTQRRIGGSYATLFYVGGTLMIETITTAVSALRATIDLAKVAIDARDDRKLAEARSAMLDRVIDVQEACMQLQAGNAALLQEKHALAQRIRDLEQQVADTLKRRDRLAQYERTKTPAGAIVYVDKDSRTAPEGAVYACATCMENGQISPLQPIGRKLNCATHGAVTFQPAPAAALNYPPMRHF